MEINYLDKLKEAVMEEILKNLNTILDKKNLNALLEVINEIYVHPQYEYIEVYYDSWNGWFRKKYGLTISGSYSGHRECKDLVDGLNQLGREGWNLIVCQPILQSQGRQDNISRLTKTNTKPHWFYEESTTTEIKEQGVRNYYQYYYEYTYILSRKKAPFFDALLNYESEGLDTLHKSPVDNNRTQEEEALQEYEKDIFFRENIKLSSKAYMCLKLADLASYEGLSNLQFWDYKDIMELPNINQDIANEIIKFIKDEYGTEIVQETEPDVDEN